MCIVALKLLQEALVAVCYLLIAYLQLLTNEPTLKKLFFPTFGIYACWSISSAMQYSWYITGYTYIKIYITGDYDTVESSS